MCWLSINFCSCQTNKVWYQLLAWSVIGKWVAVIKRKPTNKQKGRESFDNCWTGFAADWCMSSMKHLPGPPTRSSSFPTRLARRIVCFLCFTFSVLTSFSQFYFHCGASSRLWTSRPGSSLRNLFRRCLVVEPSQGKRKPFACCSFCKRRHISFTRIFAAQLQRKKKCRRSDVVYIKTLPPLLLVSVCPRLDNEKCTGPNCVSFNVTQPSLFPNPSVNFFKCTHLHSLVSGGWRRPVSRCLSRYQRLAVAAICGQKTKQQKVKVKICLDAFCCANPPWG